jgi:hypothetical protein
MCPTAQLYRDEQTIPDVEQEILLLFDEVYGRCNAHLIVIHPDFLACFYSFLEEASKPFPDTELLRECYSSTTNPIFANLLLENILFQPEKPTITIDADFLFNGYLLFKIIESWMRELVQFTDKQNGLQYRLDLLQKLFHTLRKLNHYGTIPPEHMERLEGQIQRLQEQQEQPQLGGMHLHRQLLEVGAYDLFLFFLWKLLLSRFLIISLFMCDLFI